MSCGQYLVYGKQSCRSACILSPCTHDHTNTSTWVSTCPYTHTPYSCTPAHTSWLTAGSNTDMLHLDSLLEYTLSGSESGPRGWGHLPWMVT